MNLYFDFNFCTVHIEHIRKICGVDCLGIGADYDGIDEYDNLRSKL